MLIQVHLNFLVICFQEGLESPYVHKDPDYAQDLYFNVPTERDARFWIQKSTSMLKLLLRLRCNTILCSTFARRVVYLNPAEENFIRYVVKAE